MTIRAVNWKKWSLIPHAKIWEIVALSLNVDPAKVNIEHISWMAGKSGADPKFNESDEFKDRLDVLIANYHSFKNIGSSGNGLSSLQLYISEVGMWAKSVGWSLPQEFPTQPLKFISPHLNEINENKSNRLAVLDRASITFWSNADKNDPGTHPKKREVIAWLVKNGFSKSLADKGATIIRPEWAPKGRKAEE